MTDQGRILVMTLGHILRPGAENRWVEPPELYTAYVRVVTGAGTEAMALAPFTEIAKGYCRRLRISARLVGDRLFLESVQLARA
jgi:hypothetical protein